MTNSPEPIVFPFIYDTDPVLLCQPNGKDDCPTRFRIPTRHLLGAPAADSALTKLDKLLGGAPGHMIFREFYSKHNGMGMFSVGNEDDECGIFVLPPIEEWDEVRELMFEWFYDGLEKQFEDNSFGPNDIIPFAQRNYSPDTWYVVTKGPLAGKILYWEHEELYLFEDVFAEDLIDFLNKLTDGLRIHSHSCFDAKWSSDPIPQGVKSLFPVGYNSHP